MQNRRESKSRLNSAAQHMLTNQSLRENTEIPRKSDSYRLEDLQNELSQKEMTIAALQRNYEGISHVYREEKTKSSEWHEKFSSIEKENLLLRSKIQTFESQKQKALADLDKTQDELSKLLKGFEEVRAVKTENVTIKIQFEKKRKECEEVTSRLESMKNEVESLRKIKIDLESSNKKLRADAEANDKELRKIVKDYEEYKIGNLQLEAKYAEVLNELDKIKEENERKSGASSSAEQVIIQLRQKIAADKSEIEGLKAKNSEFIVIIENYKDVITQHAAKISQIDKVHQEKVKVLNQEIYDWKIKFSAIEAMDYDGMIRAKDEELRKQNKELEKWKNEAKSITNNLNQLLLSDEEKAKANQSKEKEMSHLLELKEEEYKKYLEDKDRSLVQCKDRIEELVKKSVELKEENKKVSDNLNETEQLYAFTKKSLQQAIDENVKLKDSLNKLINEIENLRKRLVEEINAKNKLQHLSEDSLNENKNQTLIAGVLAAKNQELATKIEELEKEIIELGLKIEKNEIDLKESHKNTFEAQQKVLQYENDIDSIKSELSLLLQNNKQLTLSVKNLESESEKLHKIISSQTKDLSDSNLLSKSLKETVQRIELQLSNRELEFTKIQSQLMIEKSNYKNAVEDNNNLVKRMQEMKEERDRLKNLEESLTKKSKTLQEKEKSFSKSLERIENALNSLETNLSCHSCFNPLENAIITLPCGHLHCGSCRSSSSCKECEGPVRELIQVSRFDEIYGKIVYQKQAITDMKHLLSLN